jgi:hypothetical protein
MVRFTIEKEKQGTVIMRWVMEILVRKMFVKLLGTSVR